jgi:hypothetical protein
MIPDTLVLGIPKAMLTIALIPPILKHVFGLEKGKKKEKMNTTQQYTQNPIDNNPTFSKIKGGVQ